MELTRFNPFRKVSVRSIVRWALPSGASVRQNSISSQGRSLQGQSLRPAMRCFNHADRALALGDGLAWSMRRLVMLRRLIFGALTLLAVFATGQSPGSAQDLAGLYQISTPVSHQNLSVYFVHGEGTKAPV